MIDDTLALLDEMNEAGRIEYDDYRALHDAVSVIALPVPDAEVAERIGAILREHQPTSGMRVASGVTCRCGYWTGEERPGVTRPVGYSGLVWHQAQMIATLPAIGAGTVNGLDVRDWQQIAASKDEAVEAAVGALNRVRELHQPVDIEPSDTICGECSFRLPYGRYFGKIVDWPCATIQALDATPPVLATGETPERIAAAIMAERAHWGTEIAHDAFRVAAEIALGHRFDCPCLTKAAATGEEDDRG